MSVAPILVGGLTGDASNIILGQFNLGFLGIIIEPVDPTPPPISDVRYGGGDDIYQTPSKYKITFNTKTILPIEIIAIISLFSLSDILFQGFCFLRATITTMTIVISNRK